jgi:hypothetical protein
MIFYASYGNSDIIVLPAVVAEMIAPVPEMIAPVPEMIAPVPETAHSIVNNSPSINCHQTRAMKC